MQHLFLSLAAAASYVSAQTTQVGTSTGSSASPSVSFIGAVIPVGGRCTPEGTPCALGADCYSTNSGLQTICGNFQAQCTSDQQCAFNACNKGFCNGPLLSTTSSATAPPATSSSVCPAPGSTDSQGRYSCNPAHEYPSGQQCILVDGCYFLASTAASTVTSATASLPSASTSHNVTSTAHGTGGSGSNSTPTSSYSGPNFTGAATLSRTRETGGVFAVLFAAIAWVI